MESNPLSKFMEVKLDCVFISFSLKFIQNLDIPYKIILKVIEFNDILIMGKKFYYDKR